MQTLTRRGLAKVLPFFLSDSPGCDFHPRDVIKSFAVDHGLSLFRHVGIFELHNRDSLVTLDPATLNWAIDLVEDATHLVPVAAFSQVAQHQPRAVLGVRI